MAVSHIRCFRAQHAVVTIGAVDEAGAVMDFSIDEAEVARAMIAQAEKVTVLADRSKLGRTALGEVCRFDHVHRLVSNAAPPDLLQERIEHAGVQLILT